MSQSKVEIEVFGAAVQCASCVNAPSSVDTYEWLEAAISRKYPEQDFTIHYIDIDQPIADERQADWAQKISNDDYFYPLVLINNEMVGEGFIQLNPVFAALEKIGFQPITSMT